MNVAGLLADGIARAGDRPALVQGSRALTYRALGDRVGRLAVGLAGLGLRRGDRIVLLMPNRPELVETLWAAFHGGFVAVPVNWHLHPDEVDYIVRHCGAAAVVVSDETAAATRTLPDAVRVLRVARADGSDTGLDYEDVLAPEPSPVVETASDDPAWLFYTSGTTGRPKGATLTHRNLAAMTEAYCRDLDPVADGSVYLHAAPLTHGSGLYLLPSTARGATQVIAPGTSFSARDFVTLVEEHLVTHAAFLAPTMLRRVVDEARGRTLPSLRSVVVGGAPLYREDLRAAVGVLGPIVVQMYGQGEAPMTITVMPAPDALDHPGSCGRPFHGVEIRIADTGGEPLPDGADGEVLVRGDVVMRGYWDNPDATAATLAKGWLHTGDIGHLDAGYLHLTDRAKDVIITGGSNVYPREVEEVLLTHPAVREAAVVGVPDPEWGESVRAFVVAAGDPTPGELIQYCRGRLASFKKPREVILVAELPKNAAGKILKRELRRLSKLAEAELRQRGPRVPGCLRRGGRRIDAEQPPAVPLAEQQGKQRFCEWFAGPAVLGPDVLGEPGDVPGVAAGVQDLGEFGEPGGLRDHQPVQADEFIGVDAADDARGEHLERVVVAGRVQAHGGGELRDHGGEQPGLVAVVGVEGALGYLGRGGELVDRARAVAGEEEDAEGVGEDLGFPLAALVGRGPSAFARLDLRLPAHDPPLSRS